MTFELGVYSFGNTPRSADGGYGPTAQAIRDVLDHVASGNLRVNIEARVPLDRAHEALKTFADGTLGKVLIIR